MKHFRYQTDPQDYVVHLQDKIRNLGQPGLTPSRRIVCALTLARPEISTSGFRKNVLEAIFEDGYAEAYPDSDYRSRLFQRLKGRVGKQKTCMLLVEKCPILNSWTNRDSRFVPDAHLIDRENKTIVCYEVEDYHRLHCFSVIEYGAAWFTLEYIFWGLHLIAYDIFGNHRIIAFPDSEFLASEISKIRRPPPAC